MWEGGPENPPLYWGSQMGGGGGAALNAPPWGPTGDLEGGGMSGTPLKAPRAHLAQVDGAGGGGAGSAAAMSASAVFILDLKGKVRGPPRDPPWGHLRSRGGGGGDGSE